jgi:predicted amidohydrolase YtcJ
VQLGDPADLDRFAALGVIANFEPLWAQLDPLRTKLTVPRVGAERGDRQYPMRGLLESGAPLSFGSDWPVSSHQPLAGIQIAVTRRTFEGMPVEGWMPRERLTVDQALDAYTSGVAYQAFADDRRALAVGAPADLVWLSADPRSADPMTLREITVEGTWLAGQRTY